MRKSRSHNSLCALLVVLLAGLLSLPQVAAVVRSNNALHCSSHASASDSSGSHSSSHSSVPYSSRSHSSGSSSSGAHSSASASSHTAHGHGHTHAVSSEHHGGSKKAEGVKRDSHGHIARSEKAKGAFRKSHPCPSTGKTHGSCPGYVVDHRVALKHGGADAPSNMQWQTVEAAKAKDKRE